MAEVAKLKQLFHRILKTAGFMVIEQPSPLKLAQIEPTDNAMLAVIDGVVTAAKVEIEALASELEEVKKRIERVERDRDELRRRLDEMGDDGK